MRGNDIPTFRSHVIYLHQRPALVSRDRQTETFRDARTRCHNWRQNAKRPTSLDGGLSYNPTVAEFRYRQNKWREQHSGRTLSDMPVMSHASLPRKSRRENPSWVYVEPGDPAANSPYDSLGPRVIFSQLPSKPYLPYHSTSSS